MAAYSQALVRGQAVGEEGAVLALHFGQSTHAREHKRDTHTAGWMNPFRAWTAGCKLHNKLPSNVSESRLAGRLSVRVVNTNFDKYGANLQDASSKTAFQEHAGLQTDTMCWLTESFSLLLTISRLPHSACCSIGCFTAITKRNCCSRKMEFE